MIETWLKSIGSNSEKRPKWQMSIADKFALLTTMLVVATAILLGVVLYRTASNALVDLETENLKFRAEQSAWRFTNRLENVQRTALTLSRTPPIKGIMQTLANGGTYQGSTTQDWRQRLGIIFSGTLQANPDFLQVRYIGIADGGREIVRVDRIEDRIVNIDDAGLQQKGDRSYFQDAARYDEGSVYVSDIDLNQEDGKVVLPHQPTQRIATPVFTDLGDVFGIIIINVNASLWLEELSGHSVGATTLYLTNENADFLLHTDPAKTFGFDLGARHRIVEEIPELVPFYQGAQGKELELLPNDKVAIASRIYFDKRNPKRHFVIVAVSDSNVVLARTKTMEQWSVFITFLVIALAFPLARLLSRPLDKMMRTASRIAEGDIYAGSQTPEAARDEVNVLANAFGVMTEAVRNRENSLKESEATTRAILESAGSAILTVGGDCLIESVNATTQRMFGYTRSELLGTSISLILPFSICEQLKTSLDDEDEEADSLLQAQEVQAQCEDGAVLPVFVTITRIERNDRKTWAVVMTDLTEVKKADKAKDEFVSMVSHELRTPLTSIRGSLSLLAARAAGDLPEKAMGMIDIALRNTTGLVHLINDILDMEKIRSGKMEFSYEPTELRPLLVDAVQKNAAYADQYDVIIELVEPVPEVMLNADSDRITQVLDNLLSNAAKFTAARTVVKVSAELRGNEVCISVSDKGPGIPEDKKDIIFTEFAQADSSVRRKKGGTGLGLAIVKSIVEAHGGMVDYRSTPGEGAVFYFILPCDETREEQPEPAELTVSA